MISRFASIVTVIVVSAALPLLAADWKPLAPGLEFRSIAAAGGARTGPASVAMVRFSPATWRLDLHHRSEVSPPAATLDAQGWQKRTGAAVVINAGQYYPGGGPMGWFIKKGRNLGSRPIKAWKGVLVAEPSASGPKAALLDLEHDTFDPASSPWGVALQSFMLLDRAGKKRVRRSDWHANRTVLAEDRAGRLLMLHTEGAWTLWELADWIAHSDLDIREALSLDGGFESQMVVRAGGHDYASFGHYHVDDRGDHSLPGIRVSLPGVVALYPRGR